MAPDRSWMYQRFIDGFRNPAFGAEIEGFINFALAHDSTERDGDKLKCPCSHVKCRCSSYRSIDDIKLHIWKNGFVSDYYVWSHHGEEDIISSSENIEAAKNKGVVPDHFQILCGFHKNDNGTFTNSKAQSLAEDYQSKSTLQSRVASDGDDVDPNEVYLEVVGNKKGRRFGLGCYGKAIQAGSSSTSGYSPDVTQLQTQLQTQQQMLEEQERRMQQMREEQEQRINEQEQRMQQMREEFMQALAAMSRQQPPPDP